MSTKLKSGVLLVAAVSIACGQSNEFVAPPPPPVTVMQPVQQDVTDYVEFTGTTEEVASVEVRARVRGFLQAVHFEEGQAVKEGDLLFEIDPVEFQRNVERDEAQIGVAEAALELAEARLTRMEEAVKTNAVSVVDVLEAKAERNGRTAELASRKAELESSKLDLSYTKIYAPMDGYIGEYAVDIGNLVGSGENTLLTRIVQYDPIYAYFDIAERDLLQMMEAKSEQRAMDEASRVEALREIQLELSLANETGFPHQGNFHYADQDVDASTGTLRVRGIFPNPLPMKILPGLFVRVRMQVGVSEAALLVPERSLGANQAGRYCLVVDENDTVELRPVVVGSKVEDMRVIETGVGPTDRVVIDGILRARPGGRVSPQRPDAPAAPAGGE